MLKADRDRVPGNLQDVDQSNFRKFINDYQAKRKSTSTEQKPVGEMPEREMLDAVDSDLTPTLLEAMKAVVARDEIGPQAGTVPPDFNLKRMGSEERVRLSSFKGQKAVALIFGSYT